MLVNDKQYQSIWFNNSSNTIMVIDQRKLPFQFETIELKTVEDAFWAIKEMVVRGAPLIGVTAAYGIFLALKNSPDEPNKAYLNEIGAYLKSTRPTAVNLAFEIDSIISNLSTQESNWLEESLILAKKVEKKEIDNCSQIGSYGLDLIKDIYKKTGETVNILTHCNAGWLACVDWGTALSPIYKAHNERIPVHVWVDETRPRNQGARLTAWELQSAGVDYTVIADNAGGHLMQHKMVDMVIVGSDRTTLNGDVANKIGTYLKALAAKDNNVPFYVALPSSSIDFNMTDGLKNIPIEEREGAELTKMECLIENEIKDAWVMPESTKVANFGFDVTPAKYVTALITEKGICKANENDILDLFPNHR